MRPAVRVLITGSNRGIGLEFVRQYAGRGHNLVATCRHPDEAAELHELSRRQPGIEVRSLDVTDVGSVEMLAAALTEVPIDILINNAGWYGTTNGRLDTLDDAEWWRMFSVNAVGALLVTRALIPHLRSAGGAKVVGVSSTKASITRNHVGGSYQYRSSKAAFNAILRSLAVDLRPLGVNVFALSPGWVDQGDDAWKGRDIEVDPVRRARRFLAEYGDRSVRQSLPAAVTRMIDTIDRLDAGQSGGFFDHLGRELPW